MSTPRAAFLLGGEAQDEACSGGHHLATTKEEPSKNEATEAPKSTAGKSAVPGGSNFNQATPEGLRWSWSIPASLNQLELDFCPW